MVVILKKICLVCIFTILSLTKAFSIELYTQNCGKLLKLSNLEHWYAGSKNQFFYVKGSAKNITGASNKFLVNVLFYTGNEDLIYSRKTSIGKGSLLGDDLIPMESGFFKTTLGSENIEGVKKIVFRCDLLPF